MIFDITHRTKYVYNEPVNLCHNEARLVPRELDFQTCSQCRISIDPKPNDHRERIDFFGNRVMFFSIEQPHETLTVTATSQVALTRNPWDLATFNTLTWETVRNVLLQSDSAEAFEAVPFVFDSPLICADARLKAYAAQSFTADRPIMDAILDLMHRIYRDFEFMPNVTTISTPLADVLQRRRGVCQDFAQLAIGCLRSLGLAARYMSGYIETTPPPGRQRLQGADASHAWVSVWIPGAGWVDFDPTNDQMPVNQHIIIGWGRDYSDVMPLKGVIFSSGRHQLKVGVDVKRRDP